MANILLVAEQQGGKLRSATLNAISLAHKLSEAAGGGEIHGLVLGSGVSDAAKELAGFGLNKVLTVDDGALEKYAAETYASAVATVAKAVSADYVCATATASGKDLLPRVAALLDTGMASDISEVVGAKQFKRPMVAGNTIGTIEVTTPTVVITGRQTEWDQVQPTGSESPIEAVDGGSFDMLGAEVQQLNQAQSSRPDLAEASVVVSGGRGMKASENFKHLEELADMLGGAMGATRAACDSGLVANDLQVGQTGKIVAPDLYIAVGVSGAIQHLAGMKGSKVIVAINKDPEAPIFQVADYGLVAKWEDTLPELKSKVQAIKA
jgi:electron transfer flavoprotein alpha subunit